MVNRDFDRPLLLRLLHRILFYTKLRKNYVHQLTAFGLSIFVISMFQSENLALATRQENYSQDLNEVRAQIKNLKASVAASEEQKSNFAEKLSNLEREITIIEIDRIEASNRVNAQNKKLQQLREQRNQNLAEFDVHTQDLESLVRASFVVSRLDYIKILLSENDARQLARTLAYYRYLSQSRLKELNSLQVIGQNLAKTESDLQTGRTILTELTDKLYQQEQKFEEKRKSTLALLQNLEKQIEDDRIDIQKMKDEELRLLALIQALPEQTSNKLKTFSGKFTSMKGALKKPVDSEIVAKFRQPKSIAGTYWDGLLFAGKLGQPVRSVFTGQVVYASDFQGYGNLVIIDHGEGFLSLYAHNQNLNVQVGDWVDTQQNISSVGQPQNRSQPSLYFELRKNGVPINPSIWLRA